MTMKTIAGDHEADLALQGRLRRQVSAPTVPHLGNRSAHPGWVKSSVSAQDHDGEGPGFSL